MITPVARLLPSEPTAKMTAVQINIRRRPK
jgi:hypothetical protein